MTFTFRLKTNKAASLLDDEDIKMNNFLVLPLCKYFLHYFVAYHKLLINLDNLHLNCPHIFFNRR